MTGVCPGSGEVLCSMDVGVCSTREDCIPVRKRCRTCRGVAVEQAMCGVRGDNDMSRAKCYGREINGIRANIRICDDGLVADAWNVNSVVRRVMSKYYSCVRRGKLRGIIDLNVPYSEVEEDETLAPREVHAPKYETKTLAAGVWVEV